MQSPLEREAEANGARLRSRASGSLDQLREALAGRDTDEPRHSRLRAAMLDLMAAGVWPAGSKLPPEKEMAQAVGLSLGTVQKALNRLTAAKVLVRRHGHGTFVAGGGNSDQLLHFRFVGDDGKALVPVYAEALDRKQTSASGPWSDFLEGATSFIRVRRRINVAGEFDCLSEFYIDAVRFEKLLAVPFPDLHRVRLRTLLAEHYNAPTLSLKQHAYATEFPDSVGKFLKQPKGRRWGLVLEILSFTHHRSPVSFQRIYIPAGARQLDIPSPDLASA
ncbi:MAG TPA: GntR family transcriptional regulator [Usitatibacter sp.]|jgi:GntR family transcriptional regulator|nr:GntR family transcriptional regulator [Usitatibacter sp.]